MSTATATAGKDAATAGRVIRSPRRTARTAKISTVLDLSLAQLPGVLDEGDGDDDEGDGDDQSDDGDGDGDGEIESGVS
jgi:hypothetical protein